MHVRRRRNGFDCEKKKRKKERKEKEEEEEEEEEVKRRQRKKEKKYLTPIEEREPHLLGEQCRAGTGPSNVKETRGTNITPV